MSKINVLTEVYVVVQPDGFFRLETDAMRIRRAENIRDAIKRHVDDIQSAAVVRKTQDQCSFCARAWEVGEDGCPICCTAAVTEWEAAQAGKAESR